MAIDEVSCELDDRRVWLFMLRECLHQLGVDDPEAQKASWVLERQEVVVALRQLCADFGDNDWPDELHLGDVIDKHLGDYLYRGEG